MKSSNRRNFIRNSMLGAGALSLPTLGNTAITDNNNLSMNEKDKANNCNSGRVVWIASLTQENITGLNYNEAIKAAVTQMEFALPFSPDIYCFPELFHIASLKGGRPTVKEASEDGTGKLTAPFQLFAKTHSCYVICPVYTQHNGRYYNAALLIDRKGEIVGEYQKTRLTMNEMEKGITPGPMIPPVFKTDFGTIGIQICHDIQWHDGWDQLGEKGAEIVFWPSAFAGGKRINTQAWSNQYYMVSSTRKGTTKICDVTGDEIAISGIWSPWGVCAPINLEKAFLHSWPYSRKFPAIQKKYGRKVNCYSLHDEEISVIESLSPDLKVKDILKEFELITYKESLRVAEEKQDKLRPF